MKLRDIILESLSVYTIRVVIKVDTAYNRTEIFNKIRALPGVVIVEPENNDFLNSKETDKIGFSLLKIKFLAPTGPEADIKHIRHISVMGDETNKPIEGLLKFIIKKNSIESTK